MAITKTQVNDQIEVVGDFKHLQIRTANVIKEDGTEIARSFHRRVLNPGVLDASDNLIDTDISSEPDEIKGIANTVWTTDIKNSWKAHLIATKPSYA